MHGNQLLPYVSLLCCILPIASTSFLGGNIMVRPKVGSANLKMEVTSHFSWRRSYKDCNNYYYRNSSTLADSNVTTDVMNLACQYGCQDSITVPFLCIEYSVEDDWSYLEGHITWIFNVSDINTVTIGTVGASWINPYGNWNVSTTFSLVTRTDTGEINSTPRVVSFPYLNLLEGQSYNIPLAVIDPDNDKIRCRWALDRECSSVCNGIPGAVLDPDSCTITYRAIYGTGLKAVTVMIEDFVPYSCKPLSSVAHQFLVNVVNSTHLSCLFQPQFFSVIPPGMCINIPPRINFTYRLIALSSCLNVAITSIQVIAPIGASKSELQQLSIFSLRYQTNITWTPTVDQQNDTHLLCYMAVNAENLTSEQHCVKLAVGYHPPTPLRELATPNYQLVYPSNITLQIIFDGRIQRPSSSAFIKFHKSGEVMYQIDTSSSLEVIFNGPSLTIVPNYTFTKGSVYYINFDEGVVESVEGCHLGNDPVTNETFWTFEVIDLLPDVIAVNNQTEGQPLILQCSVTTIRDINSRVDFVWISNGIELRRVEGVVGGPTVNNLAVYTDHYIIPELSDDDNNSLYICEVVINRSQLISATGNITLNITGAEFMEEYKSCSLLPQFVEPTLPQGSCTAVPPGTLFIKQIMATSGCSNIDISSIKTFTPNDTSVGELQHVQGTNRYYVNIAWMPTADQLNSIHSFCFVAVNSAGLSSEPFCMHLAAGYHPPIPIPESVTHQITHSSNHILQIIFDRNIKRPSASAFIRFYEAGNEIYLIDASQSDEVTFIQSRLSIKPNYTFTGGSAYYVNFDGGVVLSYKTVEGCHLANQPMMSETFWTFEVIDSTNDTTKSMHNLCNNDDDVDKTNNNNEGDDDDKKILIIWLVIFAGINLLLTVVIIVTCCGIKISSKLKNVTDHTYDVANNVQSHSVKQPETTVYENYSLREAQLSTPQYVQPDARGDEENPSYLTIIQ